MVVTTWGTGLLWVTMRVVAVRSSVEWNCVGEGCEVGCILGLIAAVS